MIVITVTESRSMPGTFTIKSDANKDSRGFILPKETHGAEAAAAMAMQLAQSCSEYHVFAPKHVIELIPPDLRAKRKTEGSVDV